MATGAVVALQEVLQGELPVAVRRVAGDVGDLAARRAVQAQVGGHRLERSVEVRRRVAQADEDQAFRHTHLTAVQPELRGVEVGADVPPGDQLTVQVVRPSVVVADEALVVAAGLLADSGAAMPADVEERVHRALLASNHDDGFAGDLEQEVISDLGDSGNVIDQEPLAHEHTVHLALEDLGIAIERLLQREPGTLSFNQLGKTGALQGVNPLRLARAERC